MHSVWWKRSLVLSMTVPLALSACSKAPEAGSGETAEPAGPVSFSALALTYNKGPVPNDNVIVQELEKRLNIDLDLQWTPAAQIAERLNVMMASGDMPDVVVVPVDEFMRWDAEGAFLDVTEYVKNAPNLQGKIGQDKWDYIAKDGKYHGIPWPDSPNKENIMIRKDWLDATGSKVPTTMDEMTEVLKKIVSSDPDKNGQNDTYGFTVDLTKGKYVQTGIREAWIYGAFGLGNGWKEQNGKLTPAFLQPEMRPFLLWMKQQYDNGVLFKDFASAPGTQKVNDFRAGKSALAMVNQRLKLLSIDPSLKQIHPDAVTLFIDSPKGPNGDLAYRTEKPLLNVLAISAKNKDEHKIKGVVKLLDYIAGDEGYELVKYGIKGKHYTVEGDIWKQGENVVEDLVGDLLFFFHPDDPYQNLYKTFPEADYTQIKGQIDNALNHLLPDPTWGIEAESVDEYGVELNEMISDTIVKIVMGTQPIDYLEKQQAAWRAKGGDKVVAEMNKLYAEKK